VAPNSGEQMAELPFPSLATIEKFYGWIAEQALTFTTILSSPDISISELMNAPAPFPRSIKFMLFVVGACLIVMAPINSALWKINIFDMAFVLTTFVTIILSVLVFSFSIYLFGALFRGKGSLRSTLTAMFFSSAFMPLLYATKYLTELDRDFRQALLDGRMTEYNLQLSPFILLASLVEVCVSLFIVIRLVPVVRTIHTQSPIFNL
jgi:hypothetical protein